MPTVATAARRVSEGERPERRDRERTTSGVVKR
jgi:hypothetical protein